MSRKAIRKTERASAKSRRNKRSPAGKAPAPAAATGEGVVADLVDASARALRIPLDPAWRGGIVFNLGLILRLAALVDQFPLPDDTEPGPVFHA
jgi:Protein of unknown function (DUF4089)